MDATNVIEDFCSAHSSDSDEALAKALVERAGALASSMRAEGLSTDYKTSISDVVTDADRTAEAFVAGVITNLRPDDGILGEEGASTASKSGRTWVIDPVDGTYNFTSGFDYYCSALALTDKHNEPLFGVVHRPELSTTWMGGIDLPTTRNGQVLPQLTNNTASHICIGTYLHPRWMDEDGVRSAWMRVAKQFATVRMFGAGSVDLSLVAEGGLGAWMQHSVADWDWLPGKAIVEAAGGTTLKQEAGGVVWCVAGNKQVVEEISHLLSGDAA